MATGKSSRQTAATVRQSKKDDASAAAPNAEQLLRADHREVTALFKEFENADDAGRKQALVRKICDALVVHSMIEEEIFYPACRAQDIEDEALDEAQVEHDSLKVLIGDLKEADPHAEFYDAKVAVLAEYVRHHVKEEEKAVSGIFAKARQADVDMDALGRRLGERKEALTRQAAGEGLAAPVLRALHIDAGTLIANRKESDMTRRYEDDRDRDEDNGFGPESGRGRYGGRYTREQDDETGGRQYPRGGYSERGMGGTYGSGYGNGRRRQEESREGGSSSPGRGSRGGYEGGRRSFEGGSTEYEGDYGRGSRRESFGGEFSPGRNDEDISQYEGGRRGGYSGSFERERDDYRRSMGSQDRGRMSGGRTDRDEDYTRLGRQSRFGYRDDDYGRRSEENDYGHSRDSRDDRGGGRSSGRGSPRDSD